MARINQIRSFADECHIEKKSDLPIGYGNVQVFMLEVGSEDAQGRPRSGGMAATATSRLSC